MDFEKKVSWEFEDSILHFLKVFIESDPGLVRDLLAMCDIEKRNTVSARQRKRLITFGLLDAQEKMDPMIKGLVLKYIPNNILREHIQNMRNKGGKSIH